MCHLMTHCGEMALCVVVLESIHWEDQFEETR